MPGSVVDEDVHDAESVNGNCLPLRDIFSGQFCGWISMIDFVGSPVFVPSNESLVE